VIDQPALSQVLVVDDSKVIRRAASKILDKDFDVEEAVDGEDAWDIIQQNKNISVVFTDLSMPNLDGYGLLEKIRGSEDREIANLPVIIITGAEASEGAREEVLEMGATDFITKPFDSISLRSRAASYINYREEVRSLEKVSVVDKLTGLSTEAAFENQAEKSIAYAERHCTAMTVVRFDIDHFSELFVKHGKVIAEQILAKVSSFINEAMRKEDTAARLGVAKFALLLPSSDLQGATQVVARICQRVSRLKLKLGDEVFQISFSAGITTLTPGETCDLVCLLDKAESALKQALEEGGNKIIRYETGEVVSRQTALARVEVSIDELLSEVMKEPPEISNEQLSSAMIKLLPLISQADKNLKLGLSKVVLHLKKRLT